MVSKLEGLFLIPHELLHLAGYRLVGRRCRYRLGEPFVTPEQPLTRRQRLIGLLFPFVVFTTLFLVLTVVSGLALSLTRSPSGYPSLGAVLLAAACLITGLYSCTTIGDLRQAYLIYYNKSPQDKTPFDLFYWPREPQPTWVSYFALTLAILAALALFLILPR